MLKVENLTIGFGELPPVVEDLSFWVERGRGLGIVGLSGSGKSLVTLALVGLLPAAARIRSGKMSLQIGEERYDLRRPVDLQGVRGRHVGLIFQEPGAALNPVQRIGEQLAEAVRALAPDTEVTDWLRRVELHQEAERILRAYPHQLSGGQLQRVIIALALIGRPELLIADEPTTALDSVTEADILGLIRRLCREDKMSLIFITHDVHLLENSVDKILELGGDTVLNYRNEPADALLSSSATTAPVLEVDSVTVRYPGKPQPAVDGVSFRLFRGEWLAVVGTSGCGKTTLARYLVGLLDERWVSKGAFAGAGVKPRVAMVFQDPFGTLNPRMRVGRALHEILRLRDRAWRSDARELLTAVGLDPDVYLDRYPSALSGGQRQRVAIARALASNPDVLICDESVSALDAPLRGSILQLLDRLRRERGLSLLFITHDLRLVRRYADRLLVMEAGRIVERGPTHEIYAHPASEMGRRLLAAAKI